MQQKIFCFALCALLLACSPTAQAQQPKIYRVGVIHQGGPFSAVVEGLRDGLKELEYEDGKQLRLEIRDTHGDLSKKRRRHLNVTR